METYAKLSSKLITSSLWATETAEAKVLWITLLAMKDRDGNVSGTVPGLARLAGISIEDAAAAIERFQQPDPYSRTKDYDGRRLIEVEDGWHLINHEKYRDAGSSAERVRKHRKKKRDEPERKTDHVTPRNVTPVTCNATSVTGTHTDTDTDTDTKQINKQNLISEHFESKEFCEAFRSMVAQSRANHHWYCDEATQQVWLMELGRVSVDDAVAMLRYSIGAGAKKPITNGDHRQESTTRRATSHRGGTSFEEGLLQPGEYQT